MNNLELSYKQAAPLAERLRAAVVEQILEVLRCSEVPLGVPIESRVKAWDSIAEKIKRKELNVQDVRQLPDFVGVRLILLFRADLEKTIQIVKANLDVLSSEDTSARLGEREFGYQSQHLVGHIPDAWLRVPSLAALGGIPVEFQIRTLAQHIWAAASHKLQYKHEDAVPAPIRRTINRVAALLETVDLEFDRVLEERALYTDNEERLRPEDESLNADNLALILSEFFPAENRKEGEAYAELLLDLADLEVKTTTHLRALLREHRAAALEEDKRLVAHNRAHSFQHAQTERLQQGVFLAHVGLAREVLRNAFGVERVDAMLNERSRFALKYPFRLPKH